MNVVCMFAKFPEKGKVKTRLAKDLGWEKTIQVYEKLLKKLITYHIGNDYEFIIALKEKEREKDFKKLFPNVKINFQEGEYLGGKLKNMFVKSLKKYENVIVIGSDCPLVDENLINQSFEMLKKREVVMGPAEDGGYYLIGMKKFIDLFDSIDWSTEKVLEQTLNKLGEKTVFLLEKLKDIDTIEDYEFYVKSGVL